MIILLQLKDGDIYVALWLLKSHDIIVIMIFYWKNYNVYVLLRGEQILSIKNFVQEKLWHKSWLSLEYFGKAPLNISGFKFSMYNKSIFH